MFDDHSIMHPGEQTLLRRYQGAPNTSVLGDFFSSVKTDDYGECDVSLRSYRSSNPAIDETFGLSQQRANELLQDRLRAFAISSGDLHFANDGKCTFVAGGDHIIDVSIRDDTKNVDISTVVHKGKHAHKNHRHSRSSYYLMTKMMKHNALLSQATTGRGNPIAYRVGVYDGTFILFSSMSISMLSSNSQLELILDDFISRAAQIGTDFANTQRRCLKVASTSMSGDVFSSIITSDYGECDVSSGAKAA